MDNPKANLSANPISYIKVPRGQTTETGSCGRHMQDRHLKAGHPMVIDFSGLFAQHRLNLVTQAHA